VANLNAYFTIPPNWDGEVKASHSWRTSIQRSIVGREKRSALFTRKRERVIYSTILFFRSELVWLEAMFFKYLHDRWGFPIWPDRATLNVEGEIGQSSIQVKETANRRFKMDDECILISEADCRIYEAHSIFSVAATEIFLKSTLTKSWPVGSNVYPVIASRIPSTQVLTFETADTVGFSVDATETIE